MRRCWFFIFPFLGSCPRASRHGQWPYPWAGMTECCSLLAGHRGITGGGEASIERGRSGGSQFRIVEPQCRPALQIQSPLGSSTSGARSDLHVTQRVVPTGPWFDTMRGGNFDVLLEANGPRRGRPAARCAEVSAGVGRQREYWHYEDQKE